MLMSRKNILLGNGQRAEVLFVKTIGLVLGIHKYKKVKSN